MILSIVDRPRYGLLEISEALTEYSEKFGNCLVKTISHKKLIPSEKNAEVFSPLRLLKTVSRKECTTLILWSVGITYLLLPLIRLLNWRIRIIVVCHEPGGLRQRLLKKDPFVYSIVVSLYERLFLPFADLVVTPNMVNSQKYSMDYAPLIFMKPDQPHAVIHDAVVYLGKRSPNRSLEFFTGMSCKTLLAMVGHDVNFHFFPNETLKTSTDKESLMRHAVCTANIYRVPHNQSGVTPDSLRFGVPIIVSELDAFSHLIRKYGAGVVLDENGISTENIASAVCEIYNNFQKYSDAAICLFDDNFGSTAFKRYWLPLLQSPESVISGCSLP